MNFFRVGIIDFFGILCPGVLLLINLIVLLFTCGVEVNLLWDSMSKTSGGTILFVLLFVICYLFGFILRLVSPDYVDQVSTIFGRFIVPRRCIEKHKLRIRLEKEGKILNCNDGKQMNRSKRKEQFRKYLEDSYYDTLIENGDLLPSFFWNDECYPYYFGLKWVYYRNLPPDVAHPIMAEKEYHNKETYNFWKTWLASKDSNLATLVFQAEAFVRFMSGSFWALIIGIFSGILLIITNLGPGENVAPGIYLTAISILMVAIILSRFKNQRRREVKILLDAIFTSKTGH